MGGQSTTASHRFLDSFCSDPPGAPARGLPLRPESYKTPTEGLLPRRTPTSPGLVSPSRQGRGPTGACCSASGFHPRLHFQGPTTARGTPQEPRRSTLPRPYRLASSFQGHGVLNRKENSSPGRRQRLQGNSRYRDRCTLARRLGDVLSGTRFRNKYLIPFRLLSATTVRQTPDTLPRPPDLGAWGTGTETAVGLPRQLGRAHLYGPLSSRPGGRGVAPARGPILGRGPPWTLGAAGPTLLQAVAGAGLDTLPALRRLSAEA